MQTRNCPPSHLTIYGERSSRETATIRTCDSYTREEEDCLCLTCFLNALQKNGNARLSLAEVHASTLTVLTALTQQCPCVASGSSGEMESGMNGFHSWVRHYLLPDTAVGDKVNTVLACTGDGSAGVVGDTVVELLVYFASATDSTKPTMNTGSSSVGVLVELALFLFSAWELTLSSSASTDPSSPTKWEANNRRARARAPPRGYKRHSRCVTPETDVPVTAEPWSWQLSQLSLLGATVASQTDLLPSAAESAHPYRHDRRRCTGSTQMPSQAAAYATESSGACPIEKSVVMHVATDLVGKLVSVLLSSIQPVPHHRYRQRELHGLHGCNAALSFLTALAVQSPLFLRVLRTSDQACRLARLALPALLDVCAQVPGKEWRRGGRNVSAEGLLLVPLLRLLRDVLGRHDDGEGGGFADRFAVAQQVAVQLSSIPADSQPITRISSSALLWEETGSRGGGAPLLDSLLRLLEVPMEQATLHALVLLRDVVLDSAVSGIYLRASSPVGDTSVELPCDAAEPHVTTSLHTSSDRSPVLVDALLPLLLSQRGPLIYLSCDVLRRVLTLPCAPLASSRSITCALAERVEDYVVAALSATAAEQDGPRCVALVDVLDLVSTVLVTAANTFVESPLAASGCDGEVLHCGEREAAEHWRVTFALASVDMRLVERLVVGEFFERSLRRLQCKRAADSPSSAAAMLVDWDVVLRSIVTSLLERSSDAPSTSLFAYLRLLGTVAKVAGPSLQEVQPSRLLRLLEELVMRVGLYACGDWHDTAATVDDSAPRFPSSQLVLLHRALEPPTHQLLLHVLAAYLPFDGTDHLLGGLAMQALWDVVCTGELVSMRCRDVALDDVTASCTAEAETKCLLFIATELLVRHHHRHLRQQETFPSDKVEASMRYLAADRGRGEEEEKGNMTSMSNSVTLKGLIAPPANSRQPGLLDVLLGLCPDSAALAPARTALLAAFVGVAAESSSSDTKGLCAHEDTIRRAEGSYDVVGASMLAEVLERQTHRADSTRLLMALVAWQCRPCLEASQILQRMAAAVMSMTDALRDTTGMASTTSTDGDADPLAPLQHLLGLLWVHLQWYGALPALGDLLGVVAQQESTRPVVSREAETQVLDVHNDSSTGINSRGHRHCLAHALLERIQDSIALRDGLCRGLCQMQRIYQVHVHTLLSALAAAPTERQDWADERAVVTSSWQLVFSALGAAVMLAAVLQDDDEDARTADISIEDEEEEKNRGDWLPPHAFVQSLRGMHWLAMVFAQPETRVSLPLSSQQECYGAPTRASYAGAFKTHLDGSLHVSALHRVESPASPLAAKEAPASAKLFLHALFHCARARFSPAFSNAPLSVERMAASALGYLLVEARYLARVQLHTGSYSVGTPSAAPTTDGCCFSRSASHITIAPSTDPADCFFRTLLGTHLMPLLSSFSLAVLTSTRAVIADSATTHILRLCSLSLWCTPVGSETGCDRVLAAYAMRHVRLCLGLTEREVHGSFSAVPDDEDTAVFPGLPQRLLLVLQLLYLVLVRSSSSSGESSGGVVAFGGGENAQMVLLFVAMARRATLNTAAAHPFAPEVAVLSVAVEVHLRPTRGGAGQQPQRGKRRWFEWLDLVSFLEPSTRLVSSSRYRQRVVVLLTGMEYLLRVQAPTASSWSVAMSASASSAPRTHPRLCIPGFLEDSRARDKEVEQEWSVACVLVDWCYTLLLPPQQTWMTSTGDERNGRPTNNEETPSGHTLAARALYLLLLRDCGAVMAATGALDALLLAYTSTHTAPTPVVGNVPEQQQYRQHLVMEGWLLAAVLHVVPLVPYGHIYAASLEQVARCYLRHPVVSAMLGLSVPSTAPSADDDSAQVLVRTYYRDGVALSALPELEHMLGALIRAIRVYEGHAARRWRCEGVEDLMLLPLGTRLRREWDAHVRPSLVLYAAPVAQWEEMLDPEVLPLLLFLFQ